jgi:hypothetical protein
MLAHPDVVSERCIALGYISLVALQAAPPVLLAALCYFFLAPKHIVAYKEDAKKPVLWIRIQIRVEFGKGGQKITHKNRKSHDISSFFEVLDVFFSKLTASRVDWTSFMEFRD